MNNTTLTQERLKELLDYDPETGVFRWNVDRGGTARTGTIAGNINKRGYIYININSKFYLAHRLAWFYELGIFPEKQIDHINRNKSDNRIKNLREVTNSENHWNLGVNKTNTSGFTGVSWSKVSNKWHSYITVKGRRKHLGLFDTPEEAHAAYVRAKAEHHRLKEAA